ncbi:negative elongation factor D-like isoform X2 [Sycon ciliatum]|uniref:negative elongation factor D-like isoform X2 n=1 Tax=Sycon ciliatum TaxID=27933 RepID=UPI0020A876C4
MEDIPGAEEQLKLVAGQLSAPDAILEPGVTDDLIRYIENGGSATEVVAMLSENFLGTTHALSTMSSWLEEAGMAKEAVNGLAEQQLSSLLVKHFDATKADNLFMSEDIPEWLEETVAHPMWRDMLTGLVSSHENCYFLKHAATIISEKGYQTGCGGGARRSLTVAEFTAQVGQHVAHILQAIPGISAYEAKVKELADLLCADQHLFIYGTVLLQSASKQRHGHKLRRILQDVLAAGLEKNHDVLQLSLVLSSNPGHQRAVMSLRSMISRQALNPSDITVLNRLYSSSNPPPVELLRQPVFLELLITCLFKPGNVVKPDHLPMYSYLLVYAGCVYESGRQGNHTVNTSELKDCQQRLGIVRAICRRADSSLSDLLAELPVLFPHLSLSIIAMAMMRWCAFTLSKESVFSVVTDTIALPFVILDEIATLHPGKHQEIFDLYVQLTNNTYQTLDTLVQLELKKTLMDRFLHLISLGFVLPVLGYILTCTNESFDRSVLRHFVSELLDMVGPPFSQQFMDALLPVVRNAAVTSSLRVPDGSDPVSAFIAYCQNETA